MFPNHLQVMQTSTLTNADCRNRLAVIGGEGLIFDHKMCTFTRVRYTKTLRHMKFNYFTLRLAKEHALAMMAVRLSLVKTLKLAFIPGTCFHAVLAFLMVKPILFKIFLLSLFYIL